MKKKELKNTLLYKKYIYVRILPGPAGTNMCYDKL